MTKESFAGVSMLTLGVLACRPVLAIGWWEFLIVIIVLLVLVGPPLYRFIRRMESSRQRHNDK